MKATTRTVLANVAHLPHRAIGVGYERKSSSRCWQHGLVRHGLWNTRNIQESGEIQLLKSAHRYKAYRTVGVCNRVAHWRFPKPAQRHVVICPIANSDNL